MNLPIPLVSIIIPLYNSETVLCRCLDSIITQTYGNMEIVLVDGGSADKTLGIIEAYAQKHSFIRWISEKDKGVYDAMNKGIKMASGEWLYFLGSDDAFYDDSVLDKIFGGQSYAGIDFIYGNVEFLHSGRIYNGEYSFEKVLMRGNICHQAIFYRKAVFDKVGLYDTACRIYADHDLNIRCFSDKKIKKMYLPVIVAVYNEQDGLSANNKEDLAFAAKQDVYFRQFNRTPLRLLKRVYAKARAVTRG